MSKLRETFVRESDLVAVSAAEWAADPWCPLCAGMTAMTDKGGIVCTDCAVLLKTETDDDIIARRQRNLAQRNKS